MSGRAFCGAICRGLIRCHLGPHHPSCARWFAAPSLRLRHRVPDAHTHSFHPTTPLLPQLTHADFISLSLLPHLLYIFFKLKFLLRVLFTYMARSCCSRI